MARNRCRRAATTHDHHFSVALHPSDQTPFRSDKADWECLIGSASTTAIDTTFHRATMPFRSDTLARSGAPAHRHVVAASPGLPSNNRPLRTQALISKEWTIPRPRERPPCNTLASYHHKASNRTTARHPSDQTPFQTGRPDWECLIGNAGARTARPTMQSSHQLRGRCHHTWVSHRAPVPSHEQAVQKIEGVPTDVAELDHDILANVGALASAGTLGARYNIEDTCSCNPVVIKSNEASLKL